MNDEDDFLNRLQKLRPAEPSPELFARLKASKPRPKIYRMAFTLPFAAAAAAAAIVALAFLFNPSPKPAARIETAQPSDLRVFLPVETRSKLLEVRDLGIIGSTSAPVRLVRCTWLDDITYRDSAESTFQRASQREQIIPIALETY